MLEAEALNFRAPGRSRLSLIAGRRAFRPSHTQGLSASGVSESTAQKRTDPKVRLRIWSSRAQVLTPPHVTSGKALDVLEPHFRKSVDMHKFNVSARCWENQMRYSVVLDLKMLPLSPSCSSGFLKNRLVPACVTWTPFCW